MVKRIVGKKKDKIVGVTVSVGRNVNIMKEVTTEKEIKNGLFKCR